MVIIAVPEIVFQSSSCAVRAMSCPADMLLHTSITMHLMIQGRALHTNSNLISSDNMEHLLKADEKLTPEIC